MLSCFRSTASLAVLLSFSSFAMAAGSNTARPGAIPDHTPSKAETSQPQLVQTNGLHEGFDNITLLAANGWSLQNLSSPVGSTSWTQGPSTSSGGPFDAFNGAANAFISANYNNTGSTGTISNWLITPVLDFGSAETFTFYTRKPSPDSYADRLEVRLSTNASSTNVGNSASTVGDFTTLLLTINPSLVLGVYPTSWTQFTVTGLPHNGSGRIAFRYYVTGAGINGTNSDFIGIDQVDFSAGTPEYRISGTVSGLAGTGFTLQLNGGETLPVSANGAFSFNGYVLSGAAYSVTVSQQPGQPSQTCTLTNNSGTVGSSDVTNVAVNCVTNTYTIGGTVSGLVGSGLTLLDNGGDSIPVNANGSFTFATPVSDLGAYNVTVGTSPTHPSQTCSVTNGSGNVASANVTNVSVVCVTNSYAIGGEVDGLGNGTGLVLQLNGGSDLAISSDGAFAFPTVLQDGSPYVVTIGTQPNGAPGVCAVLNGSGTLNGGDVANIIVVCDVIFINGFESP